MKAVFPVLAAVLVIAAAADGAAAGGERAEEVPRVKREDQFCVPNSTFMMDCNECICTFDGLAASCTAMECEDDYRRRRDVEEVPRVKREEQICVPNSTFMMDCNECICEIDGLAASCTAMDCLDEDRRRREVSCKPGTTFKQGCNTCFCGEDGKSAICASVGCSEGNS